MTIRRWAPWSLLAGLVPVTAAAGGLGVNGHSPTPPSPATQSVAQPARAPYNDVAWTPLPYPGLNCQYIAQGNVNYPGSIVLEQVADVHVTGRSEPLALVVVSCNLNHVYANLYPSLRVQTQASPHWCSPWLCSKELNNVLCSLPPAIGSP